MTQPARRRRPTRRLVLVPLVLERRNQCKIGRGLQKLWLLDNDAEVESHGGSDTVSLPSRGIWSFRVSPTPVVMTFRVVPVVAELPPVRPSVSVLRARFLALDDWDLEEVFRRRGSVMRSVLRFLWRSFRVAVQLALEEIVLVHARRNELQQVRGWNVSAVATHVVTQTGERSIGSKTKLVVRFDKFAVGQCVRVRSARKKQPPCIVVTADEMRRQQGNDELSEHPQCVQM